MPPFADAIAPGIVIAQAIGRWGNWFNQELFGAPTTLPWALQIEPQNRPAGYAAFETFHPTFLYESLWCLLVAGIVVWADRRFRMGHGRVFALYVALYCVGRVWWESLRIDDARYVLGLRLNVFTAVLVGLGAVVYLVVSARLRPGRETGVYRDGRDRCGDPRQTGLRPWPEPTRPTDRPGTGPRRPPGRPPVMLSPRRRANVVPLPPSGAVRRDGAGARRRPGAPHVLHRPRTVLRRPRPPRGCTTRPPSTTRAASPSSPPSPACPRTGSWRSP